MKLDNRKQITETCCSLCCMLIQIYCTVSYDIRCPSAVARLVRSSSQCRQPNNYTCLLDTVKETYTESCNGPRPEMEGFKTTMNRNNFDRIRCSTMRYQPFTFMTTETSDCVYKKSGCAEEGQRFYDPDDKSSLSDHKCVCDYTIGYAFVNKTRYGKCFCVPSEEDCSCFKMLCQSDEQLTSEFECTRKVQIEEDMNKSPCLKIKSIKETLQGRNGIASANYITWNVKGYAFAVSAAVLLILFIIIGMICLLIFYEKLNEVIQQRRKRQKGQINLNDSIHTYEDNLSKFSQNVHHELDHTSDKVGSINRYSLEDKILANKREKSNQGPEYLDDSAHFDIHKVPKIEFVQNTTNNEEADNEVEIHDKLVVNQEIELTKEKNDTTLNDEICTENQSVVPICSEVDRNEALNQNINKQDSVDENQEQVNDNESMDEQVIDNESMDVINSGQTSVWNTVGNFFRQVTSYIPLGGKDDRKGNTEVHDLLENKVEEETKPPSQGTYSEILMVNNETITKTDIGSSIDDQEQSLKDDKINNANHVTSDSSFKVSSEKELNNEAETSNHSIHSTKSSSNDQCSETSENYLKDNTDRSSAGQTEANKYFQDPKEETLSSLNK